MKKVIFTLSLLASLSAAAYNAVAADSTPSTPATTEGEEAPASTPAN